MTIYVSSFQELQNAIFQNEKSIHITSCITCYHSITLPEHCTLEGEELKDGSFPLLMFNNGDGLGVTANNTVKNINIHAEYDHKAIYNTIVKENLGVFKFQNIKLTGQFSFIARTGVMSADLDIDNMSIIACDTRKYLEQPQKYGVNVLQGALTIYNLNADTKSNIKASIKQISIGAKDFPVVGSGVFIAGAGDAGGHVDVKQLHTYAIYSTGKIPFGVPDIITAAVFVSTGAKVMNVTHDGEIATYGVNDMVLDAWGSVEDWICNYPITSYGASGVGFVNFGTVGSFTSKAALTTYGLGARGYNQYDGTVEKISFESITTFGNGSVGIQISKKIGMLTVNRDVITHGGIGNSLVKGMNVELPAYALSIKSGGEVDDIHIGGNISTFGKNVVSYILDGGIVKNMSIDGKISAHGENSETVKTVS